LDRDALALVLACLGEVGGFTERAPGARGASHLLVAVGQIQERAHPRVQALACLQLRAGLGDLLVGEQRERLVEQALGRRAVRRPLRLGEAHGRERRGRRTARRPRACSTRRSRCSPTRRSPRPARSWRPANAWTRGWARSCIWPTATSRSDAPRAPGARSVKPPTSPRQARTSARASRSRARARSSPS